MRVKRYSCFILLAVLICGLMLVSTVSNTKTTKSDSKLIVNYNIKSVEEQVDYNKGGVRSESENKGGIVTLPNPNGNENVILNPL